MRSTRIKDFQKQPHSMARQETIQNILVIELLVWIFTAHKEALNCSVRVTQLP